MIDLRQLATFRAAVEQRTFVEAAKTLHYSQSTVTVQVKQLEAELGTPLFTRIGKRATLKQAARSTNTRWPCSTTWTACGSA